MCTYRRRGCALYCLQIRSNQEIIKKIRDVVQLFMIRRTGDSAIHGHKVVTLPKITVEWASFRTPSALAKQIDDYRKQVSKEEREKYYKAYMKWKVANQHKPLARREKEPLSPLDIGRKTAPSMRLRILADFPGLIRFVFDENGKQLNSAFIIEGLHKREDLFTKELPGILADSPKYQAVLELLQGSWPVDGVKKGSQMKADDKLVIITTFPICAWFIDEV
ncbi:hypothetical protein JMJ35_009592 [Cladonia borealis]|uniref:Uncharacterized protein n=1 Tax=Cladonia borealis TaxID=184061 RepID=A0AA39UXK0_9LECA|nr:hypothetical protein JMJ35_009592 [Cladonia borealis]